MLLGIGQETPFFVTYQLKITVYLAASENAVEVSPSSAAVATHVGAEWLMVCWLRHIRAHNTLILKYQPLPNMHPRLHKADTLQIKD